jgi:predicted alpha/beta superfamily hydrolase
MTMNASSGEGRVVFEGPMPSTALGGSRFVRIYLPHSYATSSRKRYPVLYVHDGQNAFSTVGTNVAFGWGNWQLDRTVTGLAAAHKLREIVVVAVDATEHRYSEYRGWARPYAPEELAGLKRPAPDAGDNRRFEAYARFLRDELKPKIDRDYRTLPDAKHTGVLGASLGGICSVALAWQHPETFGLAGSLSGSFQIEGRYFLERVLKAHPGKPKRARLYLDSGTVDYAGGDDGRKLTEAVAGELRRIGWKDGRTLRHFVDERPLTETELAQTDLRPDKREEARRSQHNEFYWRRRVWRALAFLFPPD